VIDQKSATWAFAFDEAAVALVPDFFLTMLHGFLLRCPKHRTDSQCDEQSRTRSPSAKINIHSASTSVAILVSFVSHKSFVKSLVGRPLASDDEVQAMLVSSVSSKHVFIIETHCDQRGQLVQFSLSSALDKICDARKYF
jgi:hypothetical protein